MKKIITYATLCAVLTTVLLARPLRAAAVDFLAIFRVKQPDVVKITMSDIEAGIQNLNDLQDLELPEQWPAHILLIPREEADSSDDISVFNPTTASLPSRLKNEMPTVTSSGAEDISFYVMPNAANEYLALLGSKFKLPERFEDIQFTLHVPPTVVAQYESVHLIETQMPYISSENSDDVLLLRDALVSIPIIPRNLRDQFAGIDISSSKVHLPVITGMAREGSINGDKGYIYNASDLRGIFSLLSLMMPMNVDDIFEMSGVNLDAIDSTSLLIWTKENNIYILVSQLSDSEKLSIARSIS